MKNKIFISFLQLLMLATLAISVAGQSQAGCAWNVDAMQSIAKVRNAPGCERVCRGIGSCTHYTWTSGDICALVRSKNSIVPAKAPANFVCGFIKGRSAQKPF